MKVSKKKLMCSVCADIHLSLQQPACRADADWMATQKFYLEQLGNSAAIILCAGDIFDKWNAPPELVNFALSNLPKLIAIPGQHDLPNHSYEERHRSAFETLCKAGAIVDITGREWLNVQGFGWEKEIKRIPFDKETKSIALIHRYVYLNEATKFQGAPESAHLRHLKMALRPFACVVFGDNHKGWLRHAGSYLPKTEVINCGTFIRRKSDEIAYKPSIGLIYDDGTIERKFLDTSRDKFHADAHVREEEAFNMSEFLEELEGLGEHGLNFRTRVEEHIKANDLSPMVKQCLLNALRS